MKSDPKSWNQMQVFTVCKKTLIWNRSNFPRKENKLMRNRVQTYQKVEKPLFPVNKRIYLYLCVYLYSFVFVFVDCCGALFRRGGDSKRFTAVWLQNVSSNQSPGHHCPIIIQIQIQIQIQSTSQLFLTEMLGKCLYCSFYRLAHNANQILFW